MEEKITVKSRTITRLQEWEGRLIGRVGEKIKRKCGGEDYRVCNFSERPEYNRALPKINLRLKTILIEFLQI